MDAFHALRRKAVRVIQYRGMGRTETLREQDGAKGYACGFEGLISYINGLLPADEVIEQALRKTVPMFPELAVRELVANALMHQDFGIAAKNASMASRLLNEAGEADLIVVEDPDAGTRSRTYLAILGGSAAEPGGDCLMRYPRSTLSRRQRERN